MTKNQKAVALLQRNPQTKPISAIMTLTPPCFIGTAKKVLSAVSSPVGMSKSVMTHQLLRSADLVVVFQIGESESCGRGVGDVSHEGFPFHTALVQFLGQADTQAQKSQYAAHPVMTGQ